MEPVFIDFHIHTSENPEKLNQTYDISALKSKIEEIAQGSKYLISLTDHNTINKPVYLKAIQEFDHILLGVELHIRNYDDAKPYHGHILFNIENITADEIDDINELLDKLYPNKVIESDDKSIPKIEEIMNSFDSYDFLLLPHGGQNHSTFDRSIPKDVEFDKTLMRSIYCNFFDGFTARSNTSLEKTHEYFDRLGIKDFVNLVTATDNYTPSVYPDGKAGRKASDFIPTWMLANPTFSGLRLSLTESSRLVYGIKPDLWAECIGQIKLKNENIDINVKLSPGLNVVIGDSSSGKSLFVDSVYKQIVGELDKSLYLSTEYGISDIQVTNPAGQHPHYLDQNYIAAICNPKDTENSINDISILKKVFPSDAEERQEISNGLTELGTHLSDLLHSVKEIEELHENLKALPKLSHLIITGEILRNPLKAVVPTEAITEPVEYIRPVFDSDIKSITRIEEFLSKNPLIEHDSNLVKSLKKELEQAFEYSKVELSIREIIIKQWEEIDEALEHENLESATKRQQFEALLKAIRKYIKQDQIFKKSLVAISKFKIHRTTKEVESMGHKLFIDNEFELTKEKFLEVVNTQLKTDHKIGNFDDIKPESLFESKFSKQKPKVRDYNEFISNIKSKFEGMNKKRYRVITNTGKDFESLSAGWKTSVILDLILGWTGDNAPLIIDQPEDNLATSYINFGLLKAIRNCKAKKQIILVSHNATIPMLGDAQNIIMCRNNKNKIVINSSPLEGSIDGESVVDLIAKTTDGGKASVKKRVKKYNLKDFKG